MSDRAVSVRIAVRLREAALKSVEDYLFLIRPAVPPQPLCQFPPCFCFIVAEYLLDSQISAFFAAVK